MRNSLIGIFVASAALLSPTAVPAAIPLGGPTPANDFYNMACNLPDAEFDVLANDTDPDSDPLTITAIVSFPHLGSAIIDNNKIYYYPIAGTPQNHTDLIRYEVSDGNGGLAVAAVSINLTDC